MNLSPSQNASSQSINVLNSGGDPTTVPEDPEDVDITGLVTSGNALSDATGSPVKSSAKPQDAEPGAYYWVPVQPDSDTAKALEAWRIGRQSRKKTMEAVDTPHKTGKEGKEKAGTDAKVDKAVEEDAQPKIKQEPKEKETPIKYSGMSTIVMI
jgi:hypothetical protein